MTHPKLPDYTSKMIHKRGEGEVSMPLKRTTIAALIALLTLAAPDGGSPAYAQGLVPLAEVGAPAPVASESEAPEDSRAASSDSPTADESDDLAGEADPIGAVAVTVSRDEPLTPFGAQVNGNAERSIPAWLGGQSAPPSCWQGPGKRYCDPYPEDRPLYVVSAANLAQYAKYLSPGQRALFEAYPNSWRMRVFPTRRSFANPSRIYGASEKNAGKAVLDKDVLSKAAVGVPFPHPASGAEVISNHRLRFRPLYMQRASVQFAVESSGDYSQVALEEWLSFPYGEDDYSIKSADGVLSQYLEAVKTPPRLAGTAILINDVAKPKLMGRMSWQFNPDEPVSRRVPNLGYDTPGLGSGGLRTNDQIDSFYGPTDYYDFKLRGKQEMLVPANSYAVHGGQLKYSQIVGPHHLNPELLRYELRRVWVVDALVRKGLSHPYRSRRFYVDEDGWQIRIVDNMDARGELWRVQEAHTLMAYDKLFELPAALTVYDLRDHRYLVEGLNNQEAEVSYPELEPSDFRSGAVSRRGRQARR